MTKESVSVEVSKENNHFAPLSIPFDRRLETFAVFWHTISIPTIFCIFLLLWINPIFWPVGITYLICWIGFDFNTPSEGNINRYSMFMRNLRIWKWFASYFPIELHKTVDIEPTFVAKLITDHKLPFPLNRWNWRPYLKEIKNGPRYIFCYHPHGIISMGVMGSFATEGSYFSTKFPGIKIFTMTLINQFAVPIYRDYILSMGLTSASGKNIKSLLSKDQSICCVVGGAQESLLAKPGKQEIVLEKRKGFIKIALQVGDVGLIPVYGFGETDIYNVIKPKKDSKGNQLQEWVKGKFGFTIPFFWARGVFNYDFGFLPFRKQIDIVVGSPITIPYIKNPTQNDIDEYHDIYIENLKSLFEDNKQRFGYGEAVLNIVE